MKPALACVMLSHRLRRVILYPAYGQVISAEGIKAAASNVPSQTHSIETRQGSKNNMVKLSLLPRVDTKQDRGKPATGLPSIVNFTKSPINLAKAAISC